MMRSIQRWRRQRCERSHDRSDGIVLTETVVAESLTRKQAGQQAGLVASRHAYTGDAACRRHIASLPMKLHDESMYSKPFDPDSAIRLGVRNPHPAEHVPRD
jgi:hypothetical protein